MFKRHKLRLIVIDVPRLLLIIPDDLLPESDQ